MSEFRQDPISGDWVIITTERARRPSELSPKHEPRKPSPKAACPFEPENLRKTGQWPPVYPDLVDAKTPIIVIPNKFPIVSASNTCDSINDETLYHEKQGGGIHNLIITRDHMKNFAALSPAMAHEVLRVFQRQYREARLHACASYAVGFFNWGRLAGASIWHPHYQCIAIPVLPPHVVRSLRGAEAYFKKNKRCVRCDILKEEKKHGGRIIAENKNAIAFTRFASKTPFEINVMPKKHYGFFEKTPDAVIKDVSALMQNMMRRLKRVLNDPDLNFFIHSAPIDGKPYPYHHWHVEILPKLTTPAGLEFSTEIYVNIIDPDAAAKALRSK